jgi:predicted DCC family thiol-disulfide oxidoreductase YuxK
MPSANTQKQIVFFDGVCNLCTGSVQWIIRRDPHAKFRFASLQGDAGKAFLQQHQLTTGRFNSIILVDNNKVYFRSAAALRITGKLSGAWPLLQALLIIPPFIRNAVYDWIARNRYRWFGKKEACWIPDVLLKDRFLD